MGPVSLVIPLIIRLAVAHASTVLTLKLSKGRVVGATLGGGRREIATQHSYHYWIMLRVILVLLAVALYVYFIIDVARTPKGQARSLPKWLWMLLVIVLPLVGGVLWLILGRAWPEGGGWWRRSGPVAPDDDPRFLRKLDDDVWSKKMKRRRGEPT